MAGGCDQALCFSESSAFGARVRYRQRTPEATVLFRIVRDHLEDFLELARQRSPEGNGVPDFVADELRRFLECGSPARGFARLKCEDCGHERLVPFSCKRRGICPSCSGRRMAEKAAHLVDCVMPYVPTRQWVLSLPFALRYRMAWDHKLTRKVLRCFFRELERFYKKRARKLGVTSAKTGAATVIQRAGGALNLNVHFHTAAPVFVHPPKPAGRRRTNNERQTMNGNQCPGGRLSASARSTGQALRRMSEDDDVGLHDQE